MIIIKAWAITDWDGEIKHPSVSIFDTYKDAEFELNKLKQLPMPNFKGENKIIRVVIREIK